MTDFPAVSATMWQEPIGTEARQCRDKCPECKSSDTISRDVAYGHGLTIHAVMVRVICSRCLMSTERATFVELTSDPQRDVELTTEEYIISFDLFRRLR